MARIPSSVAAVTLAALMASFVVPAAHADDSGSAAQATAAVVEQVTGTADLAQADASGTVQLADATLTLPQQPSDAATLATTDGATLGIRLPAPAAATSAVSPGGTVVFADPAGSVDAAVQPTTDGAVRALVSIKDASAPHEYRFGLDLPAGATVQQTDDGGLVAYGADSQPIGVLDAPWAKDANGQDVPTSYRLEGNTVVQTVSFDSNTAFPVVADPSVWHVTKCIAAITWVVGTTAIPLGKVTKVRAFVKAVGGIGKAAKLLVGATSAAEKAAVINKALVGSAADVLGIDTIIHNC